jgi:hypothetical protein
MRRHVIVGRYGSADTLHLPIAEEEEHTRFELIDIHGRLNHGLDQVLADLTRLGIYPTELGVDLLILAAHVHAADTRILRNTESQDGWTRELRLVVPVAEPERWVPASKILIRLLNFLTGDRWVIGFRPRPRHLKLVPKKPTKTIQQPFNDLALFSGGADSLIGAIDALEAGRYPLLLSHAGDGATSDAQNFLFEELKNHYRGRPFERLRLWMTFPKNLVSTNGVENTTRGRSFLFFALGVFAGTGFDYAFTLNVPENGLISLNVPLDLLRLGALSTRTTHPFYIARWNELLQILDVNGRIENPYWDRTKGEMVRDCADGLLLRRLVPSSLSCASPTKGRWQGLSVQHCGYCLPCLIRRAALNFGLLPDDDPTVYTLENLTVKPLDTRQSEGQQVRSFQFAINRLKVRPDLAHILIHKPGSLSDESPARQAALAQVYLRGLLEVGLLLKDVRTQPR